MRIEPEKRTAQFSVRELSEFSLWKRTGSRGAGQWRSDVGRAWHETLQEEMAADFAREVGVAGTLSRSGWSIRVEGRCDLRSADSDSSPTWGEIKTVEAPLPLPESELRARYPSYFRQASTYCLLSGGDDGRPAGGFVLFLDIETGIRQRVGIGADDLDDLRHHLDRIVRFLDSLLERVRIRKELRWSTFRDHPRSGQIEASELLSREIVRSARAGFEAPTGFGKTRIVLERALEELRDGGADRILYLTGKTSGQEQACEELKALFREHPPIRAYRMRNHPEHAAHCAVEGCAPGRCGNPSDTPESTTPLSVLDHPGSPESAWDRVIETSGSYGHCAYDLSRAFLAFSDLWIADYNYLFGPSSHHIFLEQPGFDAGRTWVLVDEAHNLVDRVSAALGGTLHARELSFAIEDLRTHRETRKSVGILSDLRTLIDRTEPEALVPAETTYLLLDHFEALKESLDSTPIPWSDLQESTFQTLRCAEAVDFLFARERLDPVFWSPGKSRLEWLPLDPSPWISDCLRDFSQVVFFSATLDPLPSILTPSGAGPEPPPVVRIRPQLADRFRIAIDARVETTRKSRSTFYRETARTAASFADASQGCVAVFFSSYDYADAVGTFLAVEAPHLRVRLQPRGLDALEKEHFARTAPLENDLLLLMLGGTFAEAIDHFGGVIENAMIVGPGLPQLNAINRLRIENHANPEEGFHQICRIPGMRRVNQAIGRFVRSEAHTARILLHDKRFLESDYSALLRKDLGEPEILRTRADWEKWIQ